jgi:plasmid maintenance system antidote protein VapI
MYKKRMMDLKTYLKANSITQGDFAKLLDVEQPTVSRLVRKTHKPTLDMAFKIEGITKGHVLASSWINGAAQ